MIILLHPFRGVTGIDNLLSNNSLDDDVDSFYNTLNDLVNQNVPLITSKPQSFPCQYDRKIIDCIKRKNIAHKAWKCSKVLGHYMEFKKLCALVIRSYRILDKKIYR